jgi:hypothetical protein
MKIALCFYGLVGSVSDKNGNGVPLDPSIAYKHFKKNIFDVNDEVDVFIHSWSNDHKNILIKLYKPKSYIIEKQILFPKSKHHPFLTKGIVKKAQMFLLKIFKSNSYLKLKEIGEKESFRAYSRWYSVNKSVDLMRDFEIKNNFSYDCVMSTRLDAPFFKPVIFKNFDMSFFYASNWNDAPNKKTNASANFLNQNVGKAFLDLWFFSNSKLMFKFSKLFDKIDQYPVNPHTSSYRHVITFTNNIKYVFYRWYDHELIRRKFFDSVK